MAEPSPFEVLQIAPTLAVGAVKRAYFAALQKHPPHSDPEGFRRLRQAYERLQRPLERAAAFALSPVDVEGELERFRAPEGGKLAAARERRAAAGAAQAARSAFVEEASRLTLEEARRRWG